MRAIATDVCGRRWVGMLAVIVAFAFSTLVFAVLVTPYSGEGMLDPWIYDAYSIDYVGLAERFGTTYYSTRVSAIWPSEMMGHLAGDHGFILSSVLRFGVMIACSGWIAWKLDGPRVAVAFAAVVGSSIWVLRTLADDYTQGWSLTYFALALALFVAALRHADHRAWSAPLGGAVAAGFFLELSFNGHPSIAYSAIPIAISLVVVELLYARRQYRGAFAVRRTRQRAALAGALCVGLALGYVVLAAIVMARLGWTRENLEFERVTFQFSQQLANGLARAWAVPLDNLYAVLFTLPLIVSIAAVIMAAGLRLRVRHAPGVKIALVAACAAFFQAAEMLYLHFHYGVGALGWPFTVVMLAPVAFLGTLGLISCSNGLNPMSRLTTGTIVAFAISTSYVAPRIESNNLYFWYTWVVCAVAAVVLATAAAVLGDGNRATRTGIFRPILATAAVCCVIVMVGAAPFAAESGAQTGVAGSVGYRTMATRDSLSVTRGFALRVASRQFLEFVNAHTTTRETVRVWYPDSPQWLNSVQSTLLWGYTCIGCSELRPWPIFPPAESASATSASALVVLTENLEQQRSFSRYVADRYPNLTNTVPPEAIGQPPIQAYVSLYRSAPQQGLGETAQ